jgi:pimeloyl-ACP methyl ester carboxylesterase
MSDLSSLPARSSVRTSHGDIAYRESGSGPVALFIHGLFMSADLWHAQLGALGDLRRCVAPDLLAHGRSAFPAGADLPGDMTLAGQAAMICEFLDALGAEQADLVANDTGGGIAQLVAASAPRRVRSLTLTNCDTDTNTPPPAFAPVVRMARAGALAPALAALAADPAQGRAALASGLEHPGEMPDDAVAAFLGPFTDPARAAALQAFVASLDSDVTVAIRDDLARLTAPTLIVWGTGDEFFDVSWGRWLAGTIPGTTRLQLLEGAKLFHPLERPGELTAALRDFWTA